MFVDGNYHVVRAALKSVMQQSAINDKRMTKDQIWKALRRKNRDIPDTKDARVLFNSAFSTIIRAKQVRQNRNMDSVTHRAFYAMRLKNLDVVYAYIDNITLKTEWDMIIKPLEESVDNDQSRIRTLIEWRNEAK